MIAIAAECFGKNHTTVALCSDVCFTPAMTKRMSKWLSKGASKRIRGLTVGAACASLLTAAGLLAAAGQASGAPATVAGNLAGNIYVSPTGSDANPGTQSAPVQTVGRAQALVRTLNQSMSADVTV